MSVKSTDTTICGSACSVPKKKDLSTQESKKQRRETKTSACCCGVKLSPTAPAAESFAHTPQQRREDESTCKTQGRSMQPNEMQAQRWNRGTRRRLCDATSPRADADYNIITEDTNNTPRLYTWSAAYSSLDISTSWVLGVRSITTTRARANISKATTGRGGGVRVGRSASFARGAVGIVRLLGEQARVDAGSIRSQASSLVSSEKRKLVLVSSRSKKSIFHVCACQKMPLHTARPAPAPRVGSAQRSAFACGTKKSIRVAYPACKRGVCDPGAPRE